MVERWNCLNSSNHVFIDVEVVAMKKSWTCGFVTSMTLRKNIIHFLTLIQDDIKDYYTLSDDIVVVDKESQCYLSLDETLTHNQVVDGMLLQLY